MENVRGEIQGFMYRKSEEVKVIEGVYANGHHCALVFSRFYAGRELEEYGVKSGYHYFISCIATYGHAYIPGYSYGGKHCVAFETSREEGNAIYLDVIKTKRFSY